MCIRDRFHFSRDQPQQRGFSAAVSAHYRDLFRIADFKIDMFQYGIGSEPHAAVCNLIQHNPPSNAPFLFSLYSASRILRISSLCPASSKGVSR